MNSTAFKNDLECFRQSLFLPAAQAKESLSGAKSKIEHRLRRMMVRTERLASTENRDGMLKQQSVSDLRLAAGDLKAFAVTDKVARKLNIRDTLEYWKAAPYFLNAMDRTYKVKTTFVDQAEKGKLPAEVTEALLNSQQHLLTWKQIKAYNEVDPGNARLRALLAQTIDKGAWQLLWVPPALPYYQTGTGPYADPDVSDFTKFLIFSAWQIAPKVIAMLTSYEAERRAVRAFDDSPNAYDQERKKRRALLNFVITSDNRYTGMSVMPLLYPCLTFAARIDPLTHAAQFAGVAPVALDQMREQVRGQVERLMAPVLERYGTSRSGQPDERWYWAALALLDAHYHREVVDAWRQSADPELQWHNLIQGRGEGDGAFADHVRLFWDVFDSTPNDLERPPSDLIDVLTTVALAGPGVSALRALLRLQGGTPESLQVPDAMAAAARIGVGFRSLFNLPDSMTLIRSFKKGEEERYWQAVLDYCEGGNLQASLDEYVHVLQESLGLVDKPFDQAATEIGHTIHTAVSLRTVNLDFDDFAQGETTGHLELNKKSIRCRFALRFGDGKDDDSGEETRADQVRVAFNSPFRPFVLASTSVGQEGLDFHPYCHSIFHWNLPSNPVDLEQREGRVHRYKGHVIRRNVAAKYSLAALKNRIRDMEDPWALLFSLAKADRPADSTDLIPFWIFEGPNTINRFVPALPLSREERQLENLQRTVVLYRMVFGQPRQEDLIEYLRKRLASDPSARDLLEYRIDLSPPNSEALGDMLNR